MKPEAHVLVADAEAASRELLSTHLGRRGFRVTTARDGRDAVEQFRPGEMEVVITELKLPHLDGLGVLEAVRGAEPHAKVIVMTGDGSVETAVSALTEHGAFYFLRKPLRDLEELDLIIGRAIDQRRSEIRNRELHEEVVRVSALLERQAVTDELTCLYNRRHLFRYLETLAPADGPLTMAVLDVDHFKRVNDAHGHTAGDRLLARVADEVRRQIREGDIAARYGGDEYVIVLPGANAAEAEQVVQRIQDGIRVLPVREGESPVPITLSAGIASWPEHAGNPEELFQQADHALYSAKVVRNSRCVVGQSPRRHQAEPAGDGQPWSDRFNVLSDLADLAAAKAHYTLGHVEEVAELAVRLAELSGLREEQAEALHVACLLHDLGKLAVPDEILNKPGPLTAEERKVMECHVEHSCHILNQLAHLSEICAAVLHHHERYDGKGYPNGLRGEEIPVMARVLAIADAYAAMTSTRPYRDRLPREVAVQELRRHSGTQFDPRLVELFVEWLGGAPREDEPPGRGDSGDRRPEEREERHAPVDAAAFAGHATD